MSELRFETVGVVGTGLVAALFATTRLERTGEAHLAGLRDADQRFIIVTWHGYLLPVVHYHRQEGICVLVSEHSDGEYIARVLLRNGYATVRGSSTRGGMKGLKGLVRAARAGRDLAVTPDGPRGPAGVLKPGALRAAQLTGLPILPIAVGASSGWRFRSWDGFLVPRPLSTIRLEYLEPRYVAREASRETLETIAAEVGAELNAATARLNPDAPHGAEGKT